MKMILTVKDYYRKPGTQNRMVYTDEKGLLFDGPEVNVIIGYSYWVECSSKFPEDKYYYIIKFSSPGKKL